MLSLMLIMLKNPLKEFRDISLHDGPQLSQNCSFGPKENFLENFT